LKVTKRLKLFLALGSPVILVWLMFLVFSNSGLGIFNGTKSEALNVLSGVVQGLSSIVAIVFTLIIVVVQTTLGKYITKTVQYVVLSWLNFLILTLYLGTIIVALYTMWTVDQEIVSTWVDITMVMTTICVSSLLPFFMILPRFLKLTNVMNQIKEDVLDACQEKNYELMTSKTNLLVNTIKKSLEAGEEEYAFEGTRYIEEIIEKEEYPEQRWMFFHYILSRLDDLGMRSLRTNPNYTLRILQVYKNLLQKLQDIPPVFHNVAISMVQSIMTICKDGLDTRIGQSFISTSYSLILNIYKLDILLGYFVFCDIDLTPSLRQVLRYGKTKGIVERLSFDFETNDAIMELLRNQKRTEALHLFLIIFGETPKTHLALQRIISLIIDSKVEGFDTFASSSVLKVVKQKFKPFTLDVTYDAKLEGTSELSVSYDYKIVLKTGIKKKEEAFLWIKEKMS